ncbi:MAG: hypothetical protein U0744_08030 [Gemmataceae bacterium]
MRRSAFLLIACMASCLGCAKGSDGAARVQVAGSIRMDGKPVAAGRIVFTPDTKKGNHGTQGFADISAGSYDTRSGGAGPSPGGNSVKIEAKEGDMLYTYSAVAEIPADGGAVDFAFKNTEATKSKVLGSGVGP